MRPILVSCTFKRYFSRKNNLVRYGSNPVWYNQFNRCDCKIVQPVLSIPFLGKFYFSASQLFTVSGISRHKDYHGRKLVGYTIEQMYSVVSDVENYKTFVPFCVDSSVWKQTPKDMWGKLVIGFPPLLESYTSHVTLHKPHLVKAECSDGKILNHLNTTWTFSPGLKSRPQSCVINFFLSFEFKSLIHSQIAHMLFNELVRQMEDAFIKEVERRFGPPSIETVSLKIKNS